MGKSFLAHVTCAFLAGTALCETNVCADISMNNLIHAINQIRMQDKEGLNVYQSDQNFEIKKLGLGATSVDKTKGGLSVKVSNLLLSLPHLPISLFQR